MLKNSSKSHRVTINTIEGSQEFWDLVRSVGNLEKLELSNGVQGISRMGSLEISQEMDSVLLMRVQDFILYYDLFFGLLVIIR